MLKLKILPQPELFLRLMPGVLQAHCMETLLNRMFTVSVLKELQAINGKKFLFCTPAGELNLIMRIEQHRICIHPHRSDTPDVTIRGDLISLAALCLGLEDSDSLFFSRRLLLTGDTSTGLLFKNILTRLDFDLRLELGHQLGPRTATRLWQLAEQACAKVEGLDTYLAHTGSGLGERFGMHSTEKIRELESKLQVSTRQKAKLQEKLQRRERLSTRRVKSA